LCSTPISSDGKVQDEEAGLIEWPVGCIFYCWKVFIKAGKPVHLITGYASLELMQHNH
jgi:hypothetical protein